MEKNTERLSLQFPCECVSSREENYSDPWSPISRNRLFSNGTKEEIVNLVAREPMTMSQLAKALDLSVPSVFKHVNELMASELIRHSAKWEKLHPKEVYYEPNFPVICKDDCSEVEDVCSEISDSIVDLFEQSRPKFERAFQSSGLPAKGWTFDDLTQCVFARIQRKARRSLEERGAVAAPKKHRNGVSWSFWAEQADTKGERK